MRVITSPFGFGGFADRNVISEEIDAEMGKLARALNGGLDASNLSRAVKFSVGTAASAVPYAFLEPNSLFVLQGSVAYTASTPTVVLGGFQGSVPGVPIYAYASAVSTGAITATFKLQGGADFAVVTPTAMPAWDTALGPDSVAVPRQKTGSTRIFTALPAFDDVIKVTFTGTGLLGANSASRPLLFAALWFSRIHNGGP